MSLYILGAIGLVLLGGGIYAGLTGVRTYRDARTDRRISEYVTENKSEYLVPGTLLETRDLEGSLAQRVILPAVRAVGSFFSQFTPGGAISSVNKQLSTAGNPLGMNAGEFYGLRLIVMALFALPAIYMFTQLTGSSRFTFLILFLVLGYGIPVVWLRGLVRKKQDAVRKALPDTLDMLSVCSAAGLGFDQAMQRISEYYDNPLGVELGRVILELEVGVSRQAALRNMADRMDVSELSGFVSVIIQSEMLGMSIADTLRSQAEQMRILRRYRAQEIAQKMPAKMLFPLAFFILPALLAVLLGPSIPAFVEIFGII
jgi:tight adherence protein C